MVGAGADLVGDRLRHLDSTIVSTLAHLGCASFEQLHALCFPNTVLATARIKLNKLVEAGVIMHSPWRLPSRNRHSGYIWTITQQGLELIESYGAVTIPNIPDMGRPSTAREYEEWRVRLQVRTFIVRMILEARQGSVFGSMSTTFSLAHPTPLGPLYPAQPDAVLAVRWSQPVAQAIDWLPWHNPSVQDANVVRYPIYVERQGNVASLDQLIERSIDQATASVPLVLLTLADRQRIAIDLLRQRGYTQTLRIAYWGALQASINGRVWRDAAGVARKLHLDDDEVIGLIKTREYEA